MPTIVQGPASMTVTGTWLPSSPKTWVMPILRPMSPSFFAINAPCPATSSDEPHEARLQDDQNGPDTRRRGSASPAGEHREARGRSLPTLPLLYVRIGVGVRNRRAPARGEPA